MNDTYDRPDRSPRPTWVIAIAVVVSVALPMIVSSQQAGRFFESLGTGTDAIILFATACAIIFSSPILALLISHTKIPYQQGLGFAVCIAIISFSVITTTIAINNKFGERIDGEQKSSAANVSIQRAIESNFASIASLQQQIDGLDPYKWRSQRARYAAQISAMQIQNIDLLRQQERQAASGAGSVTGETFAQLQEWGISRFGLSLLAAVLLDAIPFSACLMIGGILARRLDKRPVRQAAPDIYEQAQKKRVA